MNTRTKILAAAGLAAALACGAASAAVNYSLGVRVGPPASLVQVITGPRAGYVWTPGYWAWNGYRRVWVEGRWVVAPQYGPPWGRERWETRRDYWHPGYRGNPHFGYDRGGHRGHRN